MPMSRSRHKQVKTQFRDKDRKYQSFILPKVSTFIYHTMFLSFTIINMYIYSNIEGYMSTI